MKKYILVTMIVLLMFCRSVNGATYAAKLRDTAVDGVTIFVNSDGQIQVTDQARAGGMQSSESPYYVDSLNGNNAFTGRTWDLAVASIDTAINLIETAKSGGSVKGNPIIWWREGGGQTLTTTSQIALDVAGLDIRGLGRGSDMPTLTIASFGATGPYISAPNCSIRNVRIISDTASEPDAVPFGIFCDTNADNAVITNCRFGVASSEDWFINTVLVAEQADNVYIGGNIFEGGMGTGGGHVADSFTSNTASCITFGVVSGITIENNRISGDYGACLFNSGVATDVFVSNNTLYNGFLQGDGGINDQPAIVFANDTSAFIHDNRIISDVTTALLMRAADDATFMNNSVTDTDGDAFSGSLEWNQVGSVASHKDG